MRIAYISNGNPFDKNSWSGTDFYVRKALEQAGNEVHCIYGLKPSVTFRNFLPKFKARISGKVYDSSRTIEFCNKWAKFIKSKIQPDTDCIVSLSTIPIAHLHTATPIYVYIDAVYEQLRNLYNSNCKYDISNIAESNVIEKIALLNCRRIFTAAGATRNAISKLYDISPSSIDIIPMGANIDSYPDESIIRNNASTKANSREVNILFIGVEWYRKGADLVLKTLDRLIENSDLNLKLNLVGLKEIPCTLPHYAINHGFLDKNNPLDMNRLTNLMSEATFLMVPSRAEAYGLVFCEANAFGVPVLSLAQGGLLTIVKNGVNGFIFNENDFLAKASETILHYHRNPDEYKHLCLSSYHRFRQSLNWNVAGNALTTKITESL